MLVAFSVWPSGGPGDDSVHHAVAAISDYGPRVDLVLKADIRPGHTGELTRKLERLEQAIADQG